MACCLIQGEAAADGSLEEEENRPAEKSATLLMRGQSETFTDHCQKKRGRD